MLSLTLGPVSLPAAPLLLIGAVWLGASVAGRIDRRGRAAGAAGRGADAGADAGAGTGPDAGAGRRADAGDTLTAAAIAGLLAARAAFVALHGEAFAESPWSVLDLRDGGWHAPSGLAVALAWLLARGLRRPAVRRPLAAGALVAAGAWSAGAFALGHWERPPLPGLELVELDGGRATTLAAAAAGRPAVVNLWASWCAPCRAEMPVLAAAQQREPRVAILFVNQGESEAAVRAYLRREGLGLREVLLDAGSRLAPAVGTGGLPTTLFYDAQGRRVAAHFGVLSDAALRARIRALATPAGPD
jgi:thiol-disulfide isomerase/thioredoxin